MTTGTKTEKIAIDLTTDNKAIKIAVLVLQFLSKPDQCVKSRFLFDKSIKVIVMFLKLIKHKNLVKQGLGMIKKYNLKLTKAITAGAKIVNDTRLLVTENVFSKNRNLTFQFIKS
jgi:hypothetical protein